MKNFIKSKLYQHKSFLSNVGIVSLANIFKIVLGVILIPIYVRYVPPSTLGKFDLIVSIVPILNQLISMGLTNSLSKFYLQKNNSSYLVYIHKKILKHTLVLIVILLIIYLFSYPYSHKFIAFYIAPLFLILLVLENITFVQFKLYSLHEDFKKHAYISITKDLIRYTSLISLVIFMEDKLLALFLGNILSWLYLFINSYKYSKPFLSKPMELTETQIKELKNYSFPLLFLGLSGFFYMSVDRIMVGMFSESIDQVGYLGMAQRFTTVINIGLGSIITVLGIKMFKTHDLKRLLVIQNRYIFFLSIIFLASLIFYLLFKEQVIKSLLTESYASAYPIGIFLLLSLYWNKSRENIEYFFLICNKTALITKVFIFYTLLNIALNIYFITKFNALGAVLATNIAFFLHMSTLLFLARYHEHKIELDSYFIGIFANIFAIIFLIYRV